MKKGSRWSPTKIKLGVPRGTDKAGAEPCLGFSPFLDLMGLMDDVQPLTLSGSCFFIHP